MSLVDFATSYYGATILLFAAIIFAFICSMSVKSTFKKYSRKSNARGYNGATVAREILDANGLQNIQVVMIPGELTDHYDPRSNVVRLSESTYNSTSVAAIGVAAHECGHAVQHATDYLPIKIRTALVPVANIGSNVSWILVILGLFLGFFSLAGIGIVLFLFVIAFQLVTLPVEFNASDRAMKTLDNFGILDRDELSGAGNVLRAAAMTYVAALLVSLGNLLRMIAISNRRR